MNVSKNNIILPANYRQNNIMKGTIAICLQDLVKTKFGEDKWSSILLKSDLPKNMIFYDYHDIDDDVIMELWSNTCSILNITLKQTADIFGEYWMTEYAPKKYPAFFKQPKSAKDFLLSVDGLHEKLTANMENAYPPRFIYEDIDENTIIMTYKSLRGLEFIWLGLIKGVGKYYKENIKIEKITKNKVKIKFT